MQINPLEEWQRLTTLYAEMGDIEIRELAAGIDDLTDVARQVLRDEMKKRGLSEKHANAAQNQEPDPRDSGPWDYVASSSKDSSAEEDDDAPHEFTWKTLLCECESQEEARLLTETLKEAGVDSWIEAPTYLTVITDSRVMVAADLLERAVEIAARPIPQSVIDESKQDVPEFEAPKCPKCGEEDPTLESVDPSNTWLCESCGNTWTEPAVDATQKPATAL
jgi:hypothetical protein